MNRKGVLYLVSMEIVSGNNIHTNQVLPILEEDSELHGLFLTPLVITTKQKIGIAPAGVYKDRSNVSVFRLPIPSIMGMLYWFFIPVFLIVALPVLAFYIKKYSIGKVHCRGYSAALLCFVYNKLISRVDILFDPRGTYPEEGIITGRWTEGSMSYRLWKKIELRILASSSRVFCLSKGMVEHYSSIYSDGIYELVYALVDTKRNHYQNSGIRDKMRTKFDLDKDKVVCIYIGSLGQWHSESNLFEMYNSLVGCYGRDKVSLFVLSRQKLSLFNKENIHHFAVAPRDVPDYLMMADIGMLPGKDNSDMAHNVLFDTMISSKAHEYLAAGLEVFSYFKIKEITGYFAKYKFGLEYDPMLNMNFKSLAIDEKDRRYRSGIFCNLFDQTVSLDTYKKVYREN